MNPIVCFFDGDEEDSVPKSWSIRPHSDKSTYQAVSTNDSSKLPSIYSTRTHSIPHFHKRNCRAG